MSKFTREAPFEFEDDRLYRTPSGSLAHSLSGNTYNLRAHPEAIHAFIEAERNDTWAPDGDGFRKGRFCVVEHPNDPETWGIFHDDLDMTGSWCHAFFPKQGDPTDRMLINLADMFGPTIRDFLAWHAATYPPEPAVPEIGRWIHATTADGKEHEFEVTTNEVPPKGNGTRLARGPGSRLTWLCIGPNHLGLDAYYVTSWRYIDPPQPSVHLLDDQAGAVNIVINGQVHTVSDDVLNAWTHYLNDTPATTVAEARYSEGVS